MSGLSLFAIVVFAFAIGIVLSAKTDRSSSGPKSGGGSSADEPSGPRAEE
jgi:hypothetical protein